jgi:hypothetical protein
MHMILVHVDKEDLLRKFEQKPEVPSCWRTLSSVSDGMAARPSSLAELQLCNTSCRLKDGLEIPKRRVGLGSFYASIFTMGHGGPGE